MQEQKENIPIKSNNKGASFRADNHKITWHERVKHHASKFIQTNT